MPDDTQLGNRVPPELFNRILGSIAPPAEQQQQGPIDPGAHPVLANIIRALSAGAKGYGEAVMPPQERLQRQEFEQREQDRRAQIAAQMMSHQQALNLGERKLTQQRQEFGERETRLGEEFKGKLTQKEQELAETKRSHLEREATSQRVAKAQEERIAAYRERTQAMNQLKESNQSLREKALALHAMLERERNEVIKRGQDMGWGKNELNNEWRSTLAEFNDHAREVTGHPLLELFGMTPELGSPVPPPSARLEGKPRAGVGGGAIYARDPQGVLHQAPAGTALPKDWKLEKR